MKHFIKFHLIPTVTSFNINNIAVINIILVIYLLLLCPVSPAQTQSPSTDTNQNSLFEGKTRLGSTPPTCHNKCNQCHPCEAVQVPTMPSHTRFQLSRHRDSTMDYYEPFPSYPRNKYSNYKPLGWKCRCGNHFYNP